MVVRVYAAMYIISTQWHYVHANQSNQIDLHWNYSGTHDLTILQYSFVSGND